MNPDEARREVKRLENVRLRLAPEVMGGDPVAVAEDRRLERRIMELAGSERDARFSALMEGWRRHRTNEDESGRSGRGRPE